MDKKLKRLRRARRTRATINRLETQRLCVYRTPRHIYAQIIDASGSKTILSVSTLNSDIKANCGYTGNIDAAKLVGKYIAKKALAAGIKRVAFDRSGFKFHGRVKALADAAREEGLDF
jgi:large subunit ribosomal protein L18